MDNHPEEGAGTLVDPVGLFAGKTVTSEELMPGMVQTCGIPARMDSSTLSSVSVGSNGVSAEEAEEVGVRNLGMSEDERTYQEDVSPLGGEILLGSNPNAMDQLVLRIDTFGSPDQRVKLDLDPQTIVPSDYQSYASAVEYEEDIESLDKSCKPASVLKTPDVNVMMAESESLSLDSNEAPESSRTIYELEEQSDASVGRLKAAKRVPFVETEPRSESGSWDRGTSRERQINISEDSKSSGSEAFLEKRARKDMELQPRVKSRVEKRPAAKQEPAFATPTFKYEGQDRVFSSTISNNYLCIGNDAYKLIRTNNTSGIESGEDVARKQRVVSKALVSYKKPSTSSVKASVGYQYDKGVRVSEQVVEDGNTSVETFRGNMSSSTLDNEVSRPLNKCTPALVADMDSKFSGGMDRFNRFFSILKAGTVRFAMILALVFWLIAFFCLYPSIFSGWLVNEIHYKKGDIAGKSVTSIGLNRLYRNDRALLKDGALLTLSRYVTFDEIIRPNDGTEAAAKGEKAPHSKDEENGAKGQEGKAADARPGEADKPEVKGPEESGKGAEGAAKGGEGARNGTKGGKGNEEDTGKLGGKSEVDGQLVIYNQCSHEREFVKKSCCFRDMCEVGNLNKQDTAYFKSLYGATVYDVHFKQFESLQKGGRIIMATATLSLFFLTLVFLFILVKLRVFKQTRMREATDNLGNVSWMLSISLSILGFLLWNYYTGGSVCVDEEGNSKPCGYGCGSILFVVHIVLSGIGIAFSVISSLTREEDYEEEYGPVELLDAPRGRPRMEV